MAQRTAGWIVSGLFALGWTGVLASPRAVAEPAPPEGPPAVSPAAAATLPSAVRLFADVEDAWTPENAERLAALVDTTVVRIALKPGTPPTSAVTRGAASFLFRDQLRLVNTRSFRIVKVDVDKKGKARAEAEWVGDWGGRQGVRDVKVSLAAAISGNRWLLTEVRSND